ncbi:MAG: phytanoyl-CoA dioxygenase family protein [Capsulimonadaceae bacterium]|nr:phytanoyl-CoA dioxygenase family protein [Capsulimonadaceae bacterium]
MRDQLTSHQISTYREQGFLAIEGFLDDEELQTWRETTQDAVDDRLAVEKNTPVAPGETVGHRLNNQTDPTAYYAQVFTQCIKLADTHPGMRRLMHDPRLGRVAGELAGVDGIRIWHDQALFKPPFGNPTAWHLDNPYWSFSSRDAVSIWVALDDATLANGCMWYIPGSHKTARYDNAGIGQNLGGLFSIYPEWRLIDPVPVPAKAGTAVLHNGLTAHGAGANMTNRPRRAMTCAYMPDGATFNGNVNVLPNDYIEMLKAGDKLDDPNIVPLIWKRK